MQDYEKNIGYEFKNKELFLAAMNHSSYANENRNRKMESNERLEFLGDSILGFVVARHLYTTCTGLAEGKMTRARAELVCEQSLHALAQKLDLGSYLKLGKGEELTGGRERPSILADCTEALIAAIYLDGGIDVASDFIHRMILTESCAVMTEKNTDFKTELQERVQQKAGQTLSYEQVSAIGPDHQKVFTFRVKLNGTPIGEGEGRSKKEAEQAAARTALEEMQK